MQMRYKKLGKTDLKVSQLGFGSMRLPTVNIGGESFVDIERSAKLIRYAFDKGINYVDTGFMYCNKESEIAVGKALKGIRDKVILTTKATKQRMSKKGDLRRMLDHQLQKLDVDYIDFYCFHGIGWDSFHEVDGKTGWAKDMLKAKEEGLVRHIGFSFHDRPGNMFSLINLGYFEMVTCQYNYLDYANEEAIAYAKKQGLGVVVMGPVGGGKLAEHPGFLDEKKGIKISNAAELALRYVLSNPNVDIALSGMGTKKMVSKNIKAVENGPLSEKDRYTVKELSGKNKKLAELYCTGCGYCLPCKQGVNIPARFGAMIHYKVYGLKEYARERYIQVIKQEKKRGGEGVCIGCRECEKKCPQDIKIVNQLRETAEEIGNKRGVRMKK